MTASYGKIHKYQLARNIAEKLTSNDVAGSCFLCAENSHYKGAFQFEEAAEKAGYNILGSYPFDPESFPGYSHTNTNDDDSALEKHDEFKTWIFKLKK